MKILQNDLFIRACFKQPVERTPVWIMRQAGRYLPEYRAIRAKYDFLTMCKTPELAAEVTIQPVDIIGVDAAIIFSDILVIPEAMGMKLEIEEGRGPVFDEPIRSETDLDRLKIVDPTADLRYVLDALELTKKNLNGRVPLIGFSGAPWTLLCYMVEGKGSKTFAIIKKLIYTNPKFAHKLLQKITDAVADYLTAQIQSGADAVQIFDTWAGILSPADFAVFSLPYIEQIVQRVKTKAVPVIVFPKGANSSLKRISKCGANVVGVDWLVKIGDVRRQIGKRVAVQGNLDPTILYSDEKNIRKAVKKLLGDFGKHAGHIVNLGHGILPDIPPDNAKALVTAVKEESVIFHQRHSK